MAGYKPKLRAYYSAVWDLSTARKEDMRSNQIIMRITEELGSSPNVHMRQGSLGRIQQELVHRPCTIDICCISPKKSFATKLETRDRYIMENRQKDLVMSFSPPKPHSNHPSSFSLS